MAYVVPFVWLAHISVLKTERFLQFIDKTIYSYDTQYQKYNIYSITIDGTDYILKAEYLEFEQDFGDHTYMEKLKRKTAKSIVNNIVRININY
jgi:hypothetical protein